MPFCVGRRSLWRAGPYRLWGRPASTACPFAGGHSAVSPVPYSAGPDRCRRPALLRWARDLREFGPYPVTVRGAESARDDGLSAGSLWWAGPYRPSGRPASTDCPFVAGQRAVTTVPFSEGLDRSGDLPFCVGRGVSAIVWPLSTVGPKLALCVGHGISARDRPSSTVRPRPALLRWARVSI